MAEFFIEVPITTDKLTLADNAKTRLIEEWPTWAPNDADLEVVVLEETAGMAADSAESASRVPSSIFRAYGTKLIGLPYSTGVPATSTVTIDFVDDAGHEVRAGSEIDVDGFAFTIDVDVTVGSGTASASGVAITAAEDGSDANDLPGNVAAMITSNSAVENITLEQPTANGEDAEDDGDYQDRLSGDLELQARTLVTARDYELMSLNRLKTLGAQVPRAKAVQDVDTKHVNVTVMDEGEPISAAWKDAILEELDFYRVSNWIVAMVDPTYTVVDVTYEIHSYPGYGRDDLLARVDSMLADTLTPGNWGRPKNQGDPTRPVPWFADNVVRVNKLIDLIGDVEGVDYVTTLTIAGAGVDGNLTLPGTVALPRPGTMTGSLDTD